MRRGLSLLLLWAVLSLPLAAHAVIGTLDVAPSATLFVPYFEVDLDTPTGTDARITVVNSSASPVLTNVVIWTDAAVPVLSFQMALAGNGVQKVGLREVLAGNLPATTADASFASCTGVLPPAPLGATKVAALGAALTGQEVASGECAGLAHGDHVARGYVTIDTVRACSTRLPHQDGYFLPGGTGDATNQNVLLGDFALLDAAGEVVVAAPAVHLEASATDPRTSTAGNYTFYGRAVAWTAGDNREPLATQWAVPYEGEGSSVIAWRDPKTAPARFGCATGKPAWYPLRQESIVGFDLQENPTEVGGSGLNHIPGAEDPPPPFPGVLNVVPIGTGSLAELPPRGFLNLNLNTSPTGAGANPTSDPAAAQSYVLVSSRPEAVPGGVALTVGGAAVPLDSALHPVHGQTFNPPWPPPAVPIGASGPRPAATLLLPYFEVDLEDPNRASTAMTITNTTATAVTLRVVLWTDLGVPTWWGNVYLTGFDVSNLDLRLLFTAGLVEPTASDGQDPTDDAKDTSGISNQGLFSQDINFASCHGFLPEPRLTAAERAHLQAAHTGQPSALWGGKCSGAPLGDHVARGYVTADTVNSCGRDIPGRPGYLVNGGTGVATSQNVVTGTFTFFNRAAGLGYTGPVTHIQADATSDATRTPGNYTFYGRYLGWNASDNREPLGNRWQARYQNPAAGARTSLIVWQDPGTAVAAFDCAALPAPFPLANVSVHAFDEQENTTALAGTFLPRVAARLDVGAGGLEVPFETGFLTLDFHAADGGPTVDPTLRQATVITIQPQGSRAAALGAFQLDNPAW
ncbi:MAG: hypothetical protein HY901_08045 [Deltaproteobacteria bacterium]|nr:hypothetical protein [Deltaproteobacteria bacterium]